MTDAEIADHTLALLRKIDREVRELADRSLQLSQRAIARTDGLEARLDLLAADVRNIRSDLTLIENRTLALPGIVSALAAISAKLGVGNG